MRFAELRPELPAHLFPTLQQNSVKTAANSSVQQNKKKDHSGFEDLQDDEFGDGEVGDQDLVDVGETVIWSEMMNLTKRILSFRHGV